MMNNDYYFILSNKSIIKKYDNCIISYIKLFKNEDNNYELYGICKINEKIICQILFHMFRPKYINRNIKCIYYEKLYEVSINEKIINNILISNNIIKNHINLIDL